MAFSENLNFMNIFCIWDHCVPAAFNTAAVESLDFTNRFNDSPHNSQWLFLGIFAQKVFCKNLNFRYQRVRIAKKYRHFWDVKFES